MCLKQESFLYSCLHLLSIFTIICLHCVPSLLLRSCLSSCLYLLLCPLLPAASSSSPSVFWLPVPPSSPGVPLCPDCCCLVWLARSPPCCNEHWPGAQRDFSSISGWWWACLVIVQRAQAGVVWQRSVLDISKLLVYVIVLPHQAHKCLSPQKNAVR